MRKLVLWGHDVNEYREMFALSEEDINQARILEYGCGPSAVNVQQTQNNHEVISADPLFVLDKDTLYAKSIMIFAQMAEEIAQHQELFDFSRSGSLKQLLAERQQGMQEFFADYTQGKVQGRTRGLQRLTRISTPYSSSTILLRTDKAERPTRWASSI